MAEPEPITEELRELIEPHLKEHLTEDEYQYIDTMFSEVVYTYPNGVPLVTLKPPLEGYPAMQFSKITGEFMEITLWDYIQTVDAEAQLEAEEQRVAKEATINALMHYHKLEYQMITDYSKVYDNRTTIILDNVTLYKYECVAQTIYLKEDNYPVSYDKQAVDNDWYYYNFDTNLAQSSDEKKVYTHRVSYEWKRNTIWGYDPDAE